MRKILKKFAKLLCVLVILFAVGFVIVWFQGRSIYQEKTEENPITKKAEEIKAKENYTSLKDMNSNFLNAIIATEDRRFYNHTGVDYWGTARAIAVNFTHLQALQGGSTITQQLAKNMYFGDTENLQEKVAEIHIAWELEKKYAKEEILELYLNTIYYGDNHYGIYEASYGYFGVAPSELTLYQGTLLAGLPQAPSAYALSNGKKLAHQRQEAVIAAMVRENYISDKQKQAVLKQASS